MTFFHASVLKACVLCALQMESVFRGLDQYSEEEKLQRLLKLKLRYFTPREVANLMGFPQSFCKSKSCHYIMSFDGPFLGIGLLGTWGAISWRGVKEEEIFCN